MKLLNLYMYSLLLLSAVSSFFGTSFSFVDDFESVTNIFYIIELNAFEYFIGILLKLGHISSI